jgi:hypothetical protein
MSTTDTYKRIDANTVEVTHVSVSRFNRNVMACDQCGMFCTLTDNATVCRTMRAGETKCYGCQWANVSLSGRPYAGISFEDFEKGGFKS